MADEGDEGGYTGGGYASGGEDADTRSAERKASAVAGAARERLRSRLLPHLPQLSSQKDLTIFLIDCGPSMSQPSPLGAPPGFPAGQTCSCLSLAIWLVEQAFRKKCEPERLPPRRPWFLTGSARSRRAQAGGGRQGPAGRGVLLHGASRLQHTPPRAR